MAATITAAQTDDTGAPQVGITVEGLSGVTPSLVVVTVSWDGGVTFNAVRGGTVEGALGSTFIRDHVPALGIESTYRATVTGGSTETVEGTVTATSDFAWMQDPLDPRTAVPITTIADRDALFILNGSLSAFTRAQAVEVVQPLGARLPVASIGTRRAPSNVPLSLRALAASQGALVNALRGLFEQAGQIVVRGLPTDVPLDPVAHVIAPDVSESPTVNGILGVVNQWSMTLTQTAPTPMRIVIPWWTYDQVKALVNDELTSPTYDDVIAAMPSGKTYTEWVATPGTSA